MPAVSYDLFIEQGATFSLTFEWREDDGSSPPAGPLIDTSGYDARMQIKTRPGGDVLVTLAEGNGITVAGGIISVRIGADVTTTLAKSGAYDLELHSVTDPTEVIRLAQGRVTLSKEVTTT
jgi:hypothetical protein